MIYYKDTNNSPFAFEDNVTAEIIAKVEATHNTTLTNITLADYEAIIAPTFEQLQTAKVSDIKQSFTTATKAGYACTNGITMDADINDIIMLKVGYDLVVSLGGATMSITDYNNVDHLDIPIEDVFTMVQELGVNYETLRTKKNTLRTQVNEATSPSDLDLVVW